MGIFYTGKSWIEIKINRKIDLITRTNCLGKGKLKGAANTYIYF